MEYVFLLALVVSVCIYLTDRKGWNATAKRVGTIVRANLESAKPLKQIEAKGKQQSEQKALDSWTAEFEGKPLDSGPKHVIVKTWFARFGGDVRPYWKCKCGHSDWHINTFMASERSKEHVREQNKAEEMLKRNGGTHAW